MNTSEWILSGAIVVLAVMAFQFVYRQVKAYNTGIDTRRLLPLLASTPETRVTEHQIANSLSLGRRRIRRAAQILENDHYVECFYDHRLPQIFYQVTAAGLTEAADAQIKRAAPKVIFDH